MTAEIPHRILRQVLDLTVVASRDEAAATQERVRDLYYERLLPAMDRVLARHAAPDEVVRIDRLVLDLGRFEGAAFEQPLTEALEEALERALNRPGELAAYGDGLHERVLVERKSVVETEVEAFVTFLTSGAVPWWGAERAAFDPDRVLDGLLTRAPDRLARVLRRLAPAHRSVVAMRLARQAKHETLARLLNVMAPDAVAVVAELHEAWHELAGAVLSRCQVGEALWEAAFTQGWEPGRALQPRVFNRQVMARLSATAHGTESALRRAVRSASPEAAPALIGLLSGGEAGDRRLGPGEVERGGRFGEGDTGSQIPGGGVGAPAMEPAVDRPRSEDDGVGEHEVYYPDNAGLVLLAPFLNSLFRELGLVEAGDFVDERARRRAVLVSQHLVTGVDEHPEPGLFLNKVLCGCALDVPVERVLELSEGERARCRTFLRDVIELWEALGNTSVEGLRQGFLQRAGRLVRQEHGWHLTVERTGIDVLLERLPWGIGIVKHTWMADVLYVEW